jgi:hypothetical protein
MYVSKKTPRPRKSALLPKAGPECRPHTERDREKTHSYQLVQPQVLVVCMYLMCMRVGYRPTCKSAHTYTHTHTLTHSLSRCKYTRLGALLRDPEGKAVAVHLAPLPVNAELELDRPVLRVKRLTAPPHAPSVRVHVCVCVCMCMCMCVYVCAPLPTPCVCLCASACVCFSSLCMCVRTSLDHSQPVLLCRSGVRRMYLLVLTTVEPPKSQ